MVQNLASGGFGGGGGLKKIVTLKQTLDCMKNGFLNRKKREEEEEGGWEGLGGGRQRGFGSSLGLSGAERRERAERLKEE